MVIQDYLKGRDNNFNLLRFIAAFSVVWSHATIVVYGNDAIEPLMREFGYTLGSLAVNVFFVISGFLMAQSYLRSRNLYYYAAARFMRLIPGLFVVSILAAFVMGPVFTTLNTGDYFAQADTWVYVPITTSMVDDLLTLPGVFETHPAYVEINTPLWTLRWEAAAYVGIAILGVLKGLENKRIFAVSGLLFIILFFSVTTFTDLRDQIAPADHFLRFGLCYLVGAAGYVYRSSIPLNSLGVTVLAIATFVLRNTEAYQFLLIVTIGYGTIWLAYVPAGLIRKFNDLGDYSYGVYIYGFPVKQMMFAIFPLLTPVPLFLLAAPLILVAASISFHLVEKPALDQRHKFAGFLKQVGAGLTKTFLKKA